MTMVMFGQVVLRNPFRSDNVNDLIRVTMENNILNTEYIDRPYRDDIALLIPRVDGQPYAKSTTEATVNTLWMVTSALRPNKSRVPYGQLLTGRTDDEVHEELMALVKGMANLMQKIVHSSSWRNGDFTSFDKAEFDRELELLTVYTSDL